MINLFSVPHTGTHFLKQLLESAGLQVRARHWEGWSKTDQQIVAPIRNPYDTFVSWVNRGRDQDFLEKWQIFNEAYETQDLLILPIDTNDRDKRLRTFSAELGIKLDTDWTPVNQGNNQEIGFMDLSEVYNLPVVKQFYTQRKPTRTEIEHTVRNILTEKYGAKFAPNLFKDSVNQIMEEMEESEYTV
tara:strand:- start:4844 stop:5407 length:564 start_codon:yes stop_codon:yes gene_type:complete